MFDVISSAKNTQWFSFPNLFTKYTYSHVANEAVDFQTLPGRNYFAEFNKKSGFELLRTASKDYVDCIQRIKKRQIEDLSCGAVSKLYGSELAIGMSSGVVRIFSIEKGEFISAKFRPDKHGNGVVGLDYSNDDEYLATVYESSDICLFGMKTGIKTNSFTLDGSSTLIRFHPVKKFALAVASYQGAVTMLDVQTKKKIFFEKAAHSAPTRDIAMFSSSQDVFISCGFDCNINVYDLRKRIMVQQYTQPHPMSTVCVSTCGTFCVGGNLKGDVISFDFRNMKEPMDIKRAHDSAVARVAFIPAIGDASASMFGQTINATAMAMAGSPPSLKGTSENEGESFAKFVDVCRKDNVVPANDSKASVHDSWADFLPAKQKHNFSNMSAFYSPGRTSIDSANRSELRLKRPSKNSRPSFNHSIASDLSEGRSSGGSEDFAMKLDNFIEEVEMASPKMARLQDTAQDKTPLSNKAKSNLPILSPDTRIFGNNFNKHLSNAKTSTPSLDQLLSRHSRTSIIKKDMHGLHGITEELTETDSPDKENHHSNGQVPTALPVEKKRKSESKTNQPELVTVNMNELRNIIREQMSELEMNLIDQLNLMGEQVIDYVDNRVKETEEDVCFQRELYFNKDFTVRFESTQHLERKMQTIEEGLAALLHEPVEEKLSEYQTELAELRQHLE